MRKLLLIALVMNCLNALAQEQTKEDIEREKAFRERAAKAGADTTKLFGWTHSIITGLNLTQVSFKDWTQGGENALAYTLWLKGGSALDEEKFNWANNFRFAFGQTRLANQGLRKTDDEIYFESLLIYKMGIHINPYASATLRTQFANGFKYDNLGNKAKVSEFFDPAYLTQSVGVAYKPLPEVTTRIGVGVREVLSSTHGFADDPATPTEFEKTKVNGGFESVTDVDWKFAENMQFTSKLELFAPFNALDEVITRMDNLVIAKVNQYINVGFGVQLINEKRVSPRTQIKEVLSIGFNYTLL